MQNPMDQTDHTSESQIYDKRFSSAGEVHIIHTYVLKTDYASVSIKSRAHNIKDDVPLVTVYSEEDAMGTVVFPERHLHEVRSIIVVLQALGLGSDIVQRASETKLVLSSEQFHRSHISNGEFRWHFAISPPTTTTGPFPSPLTAPEQAGSMRRHHSIRNHESDQIFQLQLTIHRRGPFMRNIRMKQPIRYIPRPGDPSAILPPLRPLRIPRALPSPWTENRCPEVVVRGIIFGHREVEVECRLSIPMSYPVNDAIPLRLTMACEALEALDLFAVPYALDVRLLKVLAFGRNAAAIAPPFTLKDPTSYHITSWVATALWNVDGHAIQENDRWRIGLNGRLLRDPGTEITHVFAESGMTLMYYVCLFPFRSDYFQPLCAPEKILFYGRIPLTEQSKE